MLSRVTYGGCVEDSDRAPKTIGSAFNVQSDAAQCTVTPPSPKIKTQVHGITVNVILHTAADLVGAFAMERSCYPERYQTLAQVRASPSVVVLANTGVGCKD